MKVEQDESFRPIIIKLETREEAEIFASIVYFNIGGNSDTKAGSLFNNIGDELKKHKIDNNKKYFEGELSAKL